MTTSAVYDLIPNEDGGQNTRYPLGDKPAPEVAPPIPTFLDTSGETLTSVALSWGQLGDGHTKFVIQRWRFNTDTAWTLITEPGKDTRSYTDSANLEQGQHVGYRIASSDGTNQSDWAPEAWTYVLRESTGDTDLTKIRWQADWSAEADGTILGDSNDYGMWNVYNGVVSSEMMFQGRKTIKDTVQAFTGQGVGGIGFGRSMWDIPYGEENTEMWARVWVYHDPGFTWETNDGWRKFFRQREIASDGSYGGGSADVHIIAPNDLGRGDAGAMQYNKENVSDGPDAGWDVFDPNALSKLQTGVWECMEVYVRSNTAPRGTGSGAVKYWKNGILVGEVTDCRTKWKTANSVQDFLFVSYWNGDLSKDVTFRWCAPAIALRNSARNDVPFMDQDASGFPYIGMAT